MKLINAALIGLVAARPQFSFIPGQHHALEGEGGLEDLDAGAAEEPVLSNSQQKHQAAIARKEAIIAAKKAQALAKAQRFADATAAHKLNAQNKKAAFEASKLQKETAKANKEAAEAVEAALVKAKKDAKQAEKEADHAAKLQKGQDQLKAVQDNFDDKKEKMAAKKLRSIKNQLKFCNRKLENFNDFSENEPEAADFDAAIAAGATGFIECNEKLAFWIEANGEDSWDFSW